MRLALKNFRLHDNDGLALVGRLDGAQPLEPGRELIDCPRRLRWLWLRRRGALRHGASIFRARATYTTFRMKPCRSSRLVRVLLLFFEEVIVSVFIWQHSRGRW
jgi:hypothetical protein